MWSVDSAVMDDLYWPHPDSDETGDIMMTEHARVLFATLPALAAFTGHELGDSTHGGDGAVYGEVYRRAEDRSVMGPENGQSSWGCGAGCMLSW